MKKHEGLKQNKHVITFQLDLITACVNELYTNTQHECYLTIDTTPYHFHFYDGTQNPSNEVVPTEMGSKIDKGQRSPSEKPDLAVGHTHDKHHHLHCMKQQQQFYFRTEWGLSHFGLRSLSP